MLNKGPYINYAINLLDKILGDMEKYDEKNESMLPSMKKLKV
jgi:pyruvate kinase